MFVGARLTRNAQDRQFARGRTAQQIDRARAAYQDAVVLGHRLEKLVRPVSQSTGDVMIPSPAAGVVETSRELQEVYLKLKSDGVGFGTDQFLIVAGVGQILSAISTGALSMTPERYEDLWKELHKGLDTADNAWNHWLEDREAAMSRSSRWRWVRRSSRRTQLPEHDAPDHTMGALIEHGPVA